MKIVAFVVTEGRTPEAALATMNRAWPAYAEEMDRRGLWRLGRELDFPETAVTVRVRDGETLLTDGPFAETKEFVAGFDVLDCVDLDEAIEVEAKNPVAQFHPFEFRPFLDGLRLGPGAPAFGKGDDTAGIPYLLTGWVAETPADRPDDQALTQECDAWRQELAARGLLVLGNALGGPETARTMRPQEREMGGEMRLTDGPFLDTAAFIASIDVLSCADRQQAAELAATHPLARDHAVEVRPFYSE
jgi:hypothetical protein